MVDLIARKRAGDALAENEIRWWIKGVVESAIPDYQSAAMLMAICWQGMQGDETIALTLAMAESGATVDFGDARTHVVDKHSTGGVGDSTTLIAAPIAAACGARVAKISGRGLGHTGGTVDKLEAIPGFSASLSSAEFLAQVERAGIAITGPTAELVPADKLLYALRDVTATVQSLPLIASSIMSKKIAAGAGAIVLDVKTGEGAIMQRAEDAFALAEAMVHIGEGLQRSTRALVTSMEQPLGMAVGNALDIAEAIRILRGEENGPLRDVSLVLAAEMLQACGIARDGTHAQQQAERALAGGAALSTFASLVEAQGGNPRVVDDPSVLPRAQQSVLLFAEKRGFVQPMDTVAVGKAAALLGAGRETKADTIDPGVGIVLRVRAGHSVEAGDPLAELHVGPRSRVGDALAMLREAISVQDEQPAETRMILGRVTSEGIQFFD